MNNQDNEDEKSGSRSPIIISEKSSGQKNDEIDIKLKMHKNSSGMLDRLNVELNEIEKKLKNEIYIDDESDEKKKS